MDMRACPSCIRNTDCNPGYYSHYNPNASFCQVKRFFVTFLRFCAICTKNVCLKQCFIVQTYSFVFRLPSLFIFKVVVTLKNKSLHQNASTPITPPCNIRGVTDPSKRITSCYFQTFSLLTRGKRKSAYPHLLLLCVLRLCQEPKNKENRAIALLSLFISRLRRS